MYTLRGKVLIFPLFFTVLLLGQASDRQLTLEDIFLNRTYEGESFRVEAWIEDGTAYLTTEKTDSGRFVIRHDVATGEETVFLDSTALVVAGQEEPLPLDGYRLSPDERWVLFAGSERRIWRRSQEAAYILHERQTGVTRRLTAEARPQSNACFSPDSRYVAYVMGNDLYVYDLDKGKTRRLTKDGSESIINAQADWLYEEEFSLTRAYEWSPDSKSIIYIRFDQGHLPFYTLKDELQHYPALTQIRYPKVGERNSLVQVGVVDVQKGRTRWLDLGPETDIYVPRLFWTGQEGQAAFYRLDRPQHRLELVLAEARTGKTRVAAVQSDTGWVDVTDDLHFIDDGRRFIWTSEESGYRHVYLHDLAAGQARALTSGDWEVSGIVDVDEEGQVVYFSGKKDAVTEQHVYRVAFDGSDLQRLTQPGGWYSCSFAPGFKHYVQSWSDRNTPSRISLHTADGELVRWLVKDPPTALQELDLPAWELFTLTTSDGADLNAVILKPKGFNPGRKYPTVIYTYGGPGSQLVADRWGGRGALWHQYLAQEGFAVLTVDNRGTGGRGEAFKNLAYSDIGKWALNDQIEAAKWIGRQGWGDPERIAIWGWSGGGYLTALCLTAGAEYFKCGIAVAPVTDFRLYDTAWTERYMGLLPRNKAGYDSTDVLSYVDRYKGGLLLVHGTGDDNVHPQNTWQLIEKLTERNKPFDLMMYPGKNHGLPGTHYHLYSKMTRFLKANLGG
ncbi:MAG: S9 family peptidase [Candidatus Neomarinimicrobiota bacterium]